MGWWHAIKKRRQEGLPQRLVDICRVLNLTVADLAKVLGVPRHGTQAWYHGYSIFEADKYKQVMSLHQACLELEKTGVEVRLCDVQMKLFNGSSWLDMCLGGKLTYEHTTQLVDEVKCQTAAYGRFAARKNKAKPTDAWMGEFPPMTGSLERALTPAVLDIKED